MRPPLADTLPPGPISIPQQDVTRTPLLPLSLGPVAVGAVSSLAVCWGAAAALPSESKCQFDSTGCGADEAFAMQDDGTGANSPQYETNCVARNDTDTRRGAPCMT